MNKSFILVIGILIHSFTNAQSFKYLELPNRDKFLKINKKHSELNLDDECGLFAWNGEESISGNTATTVTIAPSQSLSKNYVPLPGHNKKATVCGPLYNDVFFADEIKDKFFGNGGLLEILAKNDYDLNIPLKPNKSYIDFWKWGRTIAGGKLEEGYEGEIQFDSQTPSTIERQEAEGNESGSVNDVQAAWDFLKDKVKEIIESEDPIEIVEKVVSIPTVAYNEFDPNTYLRDKFTFWKELKKDVNICIYGSACTDGLNSKNSIVGEGTKTEIHPVEQMWYKGKNGQINFAFFRDYSNRFDKIEKNTNHTPWLNTERRKFAYPIKLRIENGKFLDEILIINNKGLSDLKYYQKGLEEATLLNIKVNDSTRSRLTVYLHKERIDNKKYFSKTYKKNSNSELEFPFYVDFEDVHIDNTDPKLIHAMLVISRNALIPGIYSIIDGLENIRKIDPDFVKQISIKLAKEEAKRKYQKYVKTSDLMIVKSAKMIKQNNKSNQYTIEIIPQKDQNLNGWELISDDYLIAKKLETSSEYLKITQNKLVFTVLLKTKNKPSFCTLQKDKLTRKVYFRD
jgi:hypothetical protein